MIPLDTYTDEQFAIIQELDRLNRVQFEDDRRASFGFASHGRFASLQDQSHRAISSRRRERMIELQNQLGDRKWKPIPITQTFAVEARYSEQELKLWGAGKQTYRAIAIIEGVNAHCKYPCQHITKGTSYQEASDRAIAEHLAACLGKHDVNTVQE